jgi:REP element-mobilizing transposase RayT
MWYGYQNGAGSNCMGEWQKNFSGQNFWARGYLCVKGRADEATIRKYIREQEQKITDLTSWKCSKTSNSKNRL